MIPQSELDRIEKEAEQKYPTTEFDEESVIAYQQLQFNFRARISREGYIAGASSEYLRSASRIEELEEVLREVLRAADDSIYVMKAAYNALSREQYSNTAEVLKLKIDTLESAILKSTTEWEHRFLDGPDTSWHPGRLTNLDISVKLVYEERRITTP